MHGPLRAASLAACLLGLGCASDRPAPTATPARLVAFGDSFTDQGAYADVAASLGAADAGRFTTNPDPMWIEHVARELGLEIRSSAAGGTNHAEGFARNALPAPAQPGLSQTPIAEQVERFLAAGGFVPGDAVLINGGGNDVLLAAQAGGDLAALDAAADAFAATVERLLEAGADEVHVLSTPDIGTAPVGGSGAGGADNPLTRLVTHYNGAVRERLAPRLASDGARLQLIDATGFLGDLFERPADHGLADVTTPACTNGEFAAFACGPGTQLDGASEDFLFADAIHLAGRPQRLLGEFVARELGAGGR